MFMNPIQGRGNKELERKRASEPWWLGPLLFIVAITALSAVAIGALLVLCWMVGWSIS